ncbi:MAG: hypothetical protein L0Z50_29910 [Verrucomicrobiales bacterium]|nr:hypothetical protein [Verrucomicrobiales bacterium]
MPTLNIQMIVLVVAATFAGSRSSAQIPTVPPKIDIVDQHFQSHVNAPPRLLPGNEREKIGAHNMHMKPANAKIRALFRKLQALAERGMDGERAVAQRKLARLKARYDLSVATANDTPDLFSGRFAPSSAARWIYSFDSTELGVANAVKWAIESATKVRCVHQGANLLAEATPATARRLSEISDHIAKSFRALLARFCGLHGVSAADRSAFLMGLYDGMMNESRTAGQRLPGHSNSGKKRRTRKSGDAAGVNVHPYSIAVGLGKQIRFSAPLEQITAELEVVATKYLAQN